MRVLWLTALVFGCALADRFHEELVVSRLPSGNFLSQFRFTVLSETLDLGSEYQLFPRVLAELVSHHSVKSFSLSLAQGRWFADQWGLPPQPSAPTGAFVSAWIEGNSTQVDERWQKVINSFNGIICSSLTTLVPQLTSSPPILSKFAPGDRVEGREFRYGALAKETVCTENLTPWKKLLPCKQNGLVSLLNPLKLYDSNFHALGLSLVPVCQESCFWRLELTVTLVSPTISTKSNEVDLETIFARKVVGVCESADSSEIFVASDSSDGGFVKYDMKNETSPRNPRVDLQAPSKEGVANSLSVSSKIGGIGDYSGVLVTTLSNPGASRRVAFTHVIPWFVKVHYGTLELRCETNSGFSQKPDVNGHSFVPAVSRGRPAVIEFDFEFPAKSRCFVEFSFKKAFLRLREYPPDANHGMYVPSAVLTVVETHDLSVPGANIGLGKDARFPPSVHGNVLLVVLPVPDFSMPFNVICFVLTTISLCFGPIHNFSTKMMIPLNTKLPMPSTYRKILRVFMLILLGLAVYAQYYEIGLNEVRRMIARAVEGFEKMNSL